MFVALGMLLDVQYLTADREDGTLLRAKATPAGSAATSSASWSPSPATVLLYLAIVLVRARCWSTASTCGRRLG